MSTLALRGRNAPVTKFAAFERLIKSVQTFVEVFAEAQELANAAHRRLPFAKW